MQIISTTQKLLPDIIGCLRYKIDSNMKHMIWIFGGLSASDGPTGYKAYGAVDGNHDGTVAPYASISSIPFTYDLSMNAIRGMLSKYGPLVWGGEYGFYSAFNVDEAWFSDQYIGIDQGDIILMIETIEQE